MNLQDATALAFNLMNKHGLLDSYWKFEFDNAKRRFGLCSHLEKKIYLSKHLTELNSEERVKNTILHEIAHALVGFKHGHNIVWKRKAIEIGCDGKRCYSATNVITPQAKYTAICSNCGFEDKKHKKPKRVYSCGKCSSTFNKNYILEYKTKEEMMLSTLC
jgi:predicted SprT family Zn-dependent metalloprotease